MFNQSRFSEKGDLNSIPLKRTKIEEQSNLQVANNFSCQRTEPSFPRPIKLTAVVAGILLPGNLCMQSDKCKGTYRGSTVRASGV